LLFTDIDTLIEDGLYQESEQLKDVTPSFMVLCLHICFVIMHTWLILLLNITCWYTLKGWIKIVLYI